MRAIVEKAFLKVNPGTEPIPGCPRDVVLLKVTWLDGDKKGTREDLGADVICQHIKSGDEFKFWIAGKHATVLCEERPSGLSKLYTDKDTPTTRYLEKLP